MGEAETGAPVDVRLAELRDTIDAVDTRIVSLLAERQDVVRRVVALKKKHDLPVYHPDREEELIGQRRRQAREEDLDPDYLEDLYRRILRQSRVEQSARLARQGVRPGAAVLIVGGSGAMGRYFSRWFSEAGYRVRVLGRHDWPEVQALCSGIDLALVSVPIEVTDAVIRRLGPHLPPEAVLADLTSIKGPPMKAMIEAHQGPVVGLHPLFGPSTSTLDKQIIVFTPGRDLESCRWLLSQFAAWGSHILQSDPREHDDIMGIVQTLRHFATFAFGQFLWKKGVNLHRTLDFSSPIYRLELGMVGRLFAQDASLYCEIILASAERRSLLKEYLASLTGNLPMIDAGDKETFRSEFKKIAQWFGSFSEQAMRESTYLIDKLIERF